MIAADAGRPHKGRKSNKGSKAKKKAGGREAAG
jgi:hypothetical protein